MAFKGGAGYGDLFTYDVAGVKGDGLEVKHFAGTIMRKVIDNLVFGRALNESRDAFGKGKGGTFTIPISYDWGVPATVAPLVSGTAISTGTQTFGKIEMNIKEYGTGIGYEGYTDFWTNLSLQEECTKSLANHISRMINWLDWDILSNSAFTIEIPSTGSYSSLLGTSRKLSQAAYGELGPGGLALAYDSFKASLVPPLENGFYVLFGNSASFRNLKQGSVFQNMQLFSDMSGLRHQVLGQFMNFIAVETEELTGKGTIFAVGANAGGFGFGQLPRTFYYPDFGSDAGRLSVFKTLFYRGQGPIWRDSGTAAIIIKARSAIFDYGQLDA